MIGGKGQNHEVVLVLRVLDIVDQQAKLMMLEAKQRKA